MLQVCNSQCHIFNYVLNGPIIHCVLLTRLSISARPIWILFCRSMYILGVNHYLSPIIWFASQMWWWKHTIVWLLLLREKCVNDLGIWKDNWHLISFNWTQGCENQTVRDVIDSKVSHWSICDNGIFSFSNLRLSTMYVYQSEWLWLIIKCMMCDTPEGRI